jgi:hypothetical protein
MGWGWVSELLKGLALVFKQLFGTDKPTKVVVRDDPPVGPVVLSDEQFFDDLGLRGRADNRPGHED